MLCGTIVLEDSVVHFTLHDALRTTYTVCDTRAGISQEVTCTTEQFGAATALAIGGDNMPGASKLYPLAEAAMPVQQEGYPAFPTLRWIP